MLRVSKILAAGIKKATTAQTEKPELLLAVKVHPSDIGFTTDHPKIKSPHLGFQSASKKSAR